MVILCVICWLFFAVYASIIACSRGANGFLWFIIGMLLGPIGFALSFISERSKWVCQHCASKIDKKTKICPECGIGSEHQCLVCGYVFPEEERKL